MTYDYEELQSKTISFLRFPLIVGVVLIHTNLCDIVIGGKPMFDPASYPVSEAIRYFCSNVLSRLAVPLFFFISGFLFFYKTTDFNWATYINKLQKRSRTILMPYIFWNLVVILFFFLVQRFMPELTSGRNKLISDYTFTDWLYAFWDSSLTNTWEDGKMPINYPFWFIRDLMVVVLFSPLLHWILKRLGYYPVLVLGLCWFFGWWFPVTGLSIAAFFFFVAGAWFSVFQKNFVEVFGRLFPYSFIVYLFVAAGALWAHESEWGGHLVRLSILVGIPFFVSLSARCIHAGRWKASAFLASSSFFIYAYHALPHAFVQKYFVKLLSPHSEIALTILYFCCAIVTVCIGLGIYALMKRYLPRVTAVITGGR